MFWMNQQKWGHNEEHTVNERIKECQHLFSLFLSTLDSKGQRSEVRQKWGGVDKELTFIDDSGMSTNRQNGAVKMRMKQK